MNRRRYYNLFSHVYDRIIALHSRDSASNLRKFLIKEAGIKAGDRILDICTGTGAVPIAAVGLLKDSVSVTGLDFSFGMLKKAVNKCRDFPNIDFVLADAAEMPFPSSVFNVVTCSHAMYELGSTIRQNVLLEASRVLVPGGCFVMMEHCEPEKGLVRFLYKMRIGILGSSQDIEFARNEIPVLSRHFENVKMVKAPGGRTKVISGFRTS